MLSKTNLYILIYTIVGFLHHFKSNIKIFQITWFFYLDFIKIKNFTSSRVANNNLTATRSNELYFSAHASQFPLISLTRTFFLFNYHIAKRREIRSLRWTRTRLLNYEQETKPTRAQARPTER